jgi:hypothetical protein
VCQTLHPKTRQRQRTSRLVLEHQAVKVEHEPIRLDDAGSKRRIRSHGGGFVRLKLVRFHVHALLTVWQSKFMN